MCDVPVVHTACSVVGGVSKSAASSAFQAVVDAFAKGLSDIVKALMTFWIHAPEPDLGPSSPVINTLDSLTRPLVAFGALLGLLVGGVRLVWTARHEQPAQAIFRGLLLMTAVTAAGSLVVEVLLTGFDNLAAAILDDGFNGKSVGDQLLALGSLPGVGGGLVFILAFFGMIASLVQVGIMLIRGAILAVLVGVLPVAAGASITEAGFGWFKRLCGWILSFTLYKLTAAVIYAAAFALMGSSNDLPGIVSGYALIILAILALPALLRLLPPSAEAMGAGSGGLLAGAASAGATGAVALSGRGGGSSAPPAATAAPGLKGGSNNPGPTGANRAAGGRSGDPGSAAPTAGGGGAAAGAAGKGASGSAAAAGGPAGAGVMVAQQAHSTAKAAAHSAIGEGSE